MPDDPHWLDRLTDYDWTDASRERALQGAAGVVAGLAPAYALDLAHAGFDPEPEPTDG